MKRVGILGSTGSIGRNALDVLKSLNGFKVSFLACHSNVDLLLKQAERFNPEYLCAIDKEAGKILKNRSPFPVRIGFEEINSLLEKIDIILIGTRGSGVIDILLESIKLGIRIAMANKETLVAFRPMLREKIQNGDVIPVDSEHSAIFQALQSGRLEDVKKVILTASGGPFKDRDHLENITPDEALKHPNWVMGEKITIDSATLFNKGLEAHEALTLFNLSPEKIEVVVHPQSIIHSMVEYMDGSIIAQMSLPDMRIPIQYAFTYPERHSSPVPSVDFVQVSSLTFGKPDTRRFPLLKLALDILKEENTLPAVMSKADEVAVDAFLKGKIGFTDIHRIVKETVDAHKPFEVREVGDVKEAEEWAENYAKELIK